MSYYMGDYYRGDPGFWSFTKGLLGKAAGFIPVVGPALSAGIGALPGGTAAKVAQLPGGIAASGKISGAVQSIVRQVGGKIVQHPVATAAAAAGAMGAMGVGAVAERMAFGGGAGGHGHVLKRCGTILKSGKKAKCHRSMNVCNPRALRRAIRRTRGFAKLAMRTIHIVHPKKKGRFGGFKKRKRS